MNTHLWSSVAEECQLPPGSDEAGAVEIKLMNLEICWGSAVRSILEVYNMKTLEWADETEVSRRSPDGRISNSSGRAVISGSEEKQNDTGHDK